MPDSPPELTSRDLRIGQVFETAAMLLTQDEITAFAASFDPQPMHLDAHAARDTFLGQLVASGWHVAALTMRLMVEARPLGATPLVGVEVLRLRFRRPVPPGTSLRCRATITAIEPTSKPDRDYVTMEVETLDAATGAVLVSQSWKLLVPSVAA